MEDSEVVKRALWFAIEAPVSLKGVYKKLKVHPPGTTFAVDRRGWNVHLRPLPRRKSKGGRIKQATETHKLREWLQTQLQRLAREDPDKAVILSGNILRVNFGGVDMAAGEALSKSFRGGDKLPIEVFVVYAAALIAEPSGQWRKWLRQCLQCKQVFYAKSTGGARSHLCSVKCKKRRGAERVSRHRSNVRNGKKRTRKSPS